MFFSRKEEYLVADLGGTNVTIAIIDVNRNILFKKTCPSSEIKNFTDTLIQFIHLPECKKYKFKRSCIAVAGVINAERNYARLTNRDWTVDKNSILVRTKLHDVTLLNDFEAIGFGIDTLKPEQYTELTNLGRNSDGTLAIIGAGTGLGMSILPYYDNSHLPILSEGGHVDLPLQANDKIDIKLYTFLKQKKLYRDAEDVVSGRGLVNIYRFFLEQNIKHNKKIRLEIGKVKDEEKPALITKYALEDKDVVCMRTVQLFIKYYARIARNLALTSLCSELIISGGIAPKILPALQDVFVNEFVQHDVPNMRKLLEQVSIFVIINPNVGLYGALNAVKT